MSVNLTIGVDKKEWSKKVLYPKFLVFHNHKNHIRNFLCIIFKTVRLLNITINTNDFYMS